MNTLAFADRASHLNLRTSPGLKQRHQPWSQIAVATTVVFLLCTSMAVADDRTLLGVSVWTKPAEFSASIAVCFATLAWFAPLLMAVAFLVMDLEILRTHRSGNPLRWRWLQRCAASMTISSSGTGNTRYPDH